MMAEPKERSSWLSFLFFPPLREMEIALMKICSTTIISLMYPVNHFTLICYEVFPLLLQINLLIHMIFLAIWDNECIDEGKR